MRKVVHPPELGGLDRPDLIGASDVPAITGTSRWSSRADLLARLRGARSESPGKAAAFGHLLEPVLLEVARVTTGLPIVKPPTWIHPKGRPWQRLSLDGMAPDPGGGGLRIFEFKTTGDFLFRSNWTKDSPAPYVADQVQAQLEATGACAAEVFVWVHSAGGPRIYRYEVLPSPLRASEIVEACEALWAEKEVVGEQEQETW